MTNDSTEKSHYRGTPEYRYAYSELLLAARYRGHLTYQEVAHMAGLPLSGQHMGRMVGLLLGEISEDEHRAGRPLLSAIAVNSQGKVSKGFFDLARYLGALDGDDPEREAEFLRREQARVYEHWKRPLPKPKPKARPAPRGEEIELDAEDDAILDGVWDRIGAERALGEAFAAYFGEIGARLPKEDLAARRRGELRAGSNHIQYLFGGDERGEYVDIYLSNRFVSGDTHARLRPGVAAEDLPTPQDVEFGWDSDEVKRQRKEQNARAYALLREKGFI